MSGSETFAQYCAKQGLEKDTIATLTDAGFTQKEELSSLDKKEIDVLPLRVQQKHTLVKVVDTVREQNAMKRIERKQADEQPTDNEVRIVLFGKTGSGKSATGNTILGPDISNGFEESNSLNVTTKLCQRRSIKINGRNIRVVDTPGLMDAARDQKEVANELTRCLLMSSPGPHVLLFVLNISERFTLQEFHAYVMLKKLFDSHLKRYVGVLFTHGDKLPKGETMETVLKREEQAFEKVPYNATERKNHLKMLLHDVQNRTILFSNRGDQDTKDQQVLELLRLISGMKENNAPMPFFSDKKTQLTSGFLRDMVDEYSYPGVSREEAWEEVMRNKAVMGAFGLAGEGIGGKAYEVGELTSQVGAGVVGGLTAGVAASVVSLFFAQKREQCSVM